MYIKAYEGMNKNPASFNNHYRSLDDLRHGENIYSHGFIRISPLSVIVIKVFVKQYKLYENV